MHKVLSRNDELVSIVRFCTIYDAIAFQRCCKHWKRLIRDKVLSPYLMLRFPEIDTYCADNDDRATHLTSLLRHEPLNLQALLHGPSKIDLHLSLCGDNAYKVVKGSLVRSYWDECVQQL